MVSVPILIDEFQRRPESAGLWFAVIQLKLSCRTPISNAFGAGLHSSCCLRHIMYMMVSHAVVYNCVYHRHWDEPNWAQILLCPPCRQQTPAVQGPSPDEHCIGVESWRYNGWKQRTTDIDQTGIDQTAIDQAGMRWTYPVLCPSLQHLFVILLKECNGLQRQKRSNVNYSTVSSWDMIVVKR
jgi:hypothetical protein